MPAIVTYWFAWSAFHEDTLLYDQTADLEEAVVPE
jgi:hypothetical protein